MDWEERYLKEASSDGLNKDARQFIKSLGKGWSWDRRKNNHIVLTWEHANGHPDGSFTMSNSPSDSRSKKN